MNFLKPLFSAADYLPHSFCYLSQPSLIRLHLLTDLAIGISYVAIAMTLAYLVYRMRRDIPFHWMVLAFGLFIIACGFTHFMEVLTLWIPLYWLTGGVKLVTAVASVVTAVLLPPLVPKTRGLIHAARTSQQYKLELEKSHAELESLYARLKGLDELKSRLFANVSHELRTPLALILGPADKMLARSDLPLEQRRDVEVMQRNARTLLKHVNDLLDLAKLESGKMEMRCLDSDLAKLFRTTSAHFDGIAYDRQIEFVVEAPPSLPVWIDPEKMERVLLNLLSNAFKFTPDAGKIRFVLEAVDDRVLVTIRDSGPGVPTEMREAIFDRFCQVESAETRRFDGAGLGLAIAKEFVELHEGAIAAGDAPEGGAMFVVNLPRLAVRGEFAQRADGIKRNIEEVAAISGAFRLNSGKPAATKAEPSVSHQDVRPVVLVVEDNPEMNTFLSDTLARDYVIESAFDGEEGLRKALTVLPDLILTDIMMPRMSGDRLLASIRARSEFDNTAVIVLTAKADDQARVELLQSGAQDYILKPFSVAELRTRVDNAIRLKRMRDLLQSELASKESDVLVLSQELKLREARFRVAVESAAYGIVIVGERGEIQFVNSQTGKMFGYQREELLGRTIDILVPDQFRAQHHRHRADFATHPKPRPMAAGRDVYGLHKDGSEIPVEITLNPIQLDGQSMFLGCIVDITERKQAERERETLLEREQRARARAEESSRLKDEFLATLSHELRTPLTAIMGWSQLLGKGDLAKTQVEQAVQTISRNAKAQLQLIEDLLDVSRIISGKLRVECCPVNLDEITAHAIEVILPTAQVKGVQVKVDLQPEIPTVNGDPDRLQQVIWNLLSNAVKFTPKGGWVQVMLDNLPEGVRLVVQDSGQGIEPEFAPYIFDRFSQADSSTTRSHDGLGLGLSIVRHLVQAHGGSIYAQSEGKGKGAKFSVILPAQDGAVRIPAIPASSHSVWAERRMLSGCRLLVVDDRPDELELFKTVLEAEGAEVITANGVAAALELLQENPADILVSDIAMPEQDGYELIRQVRELPPERGGFIPAVAVTAYARIEDRERAIASGFQAYVSKPVQAEKLVEAVAHSCMVRMITPGQRRKKN